MTAKRPQSKRRTPRPAAGILLRYIDEHNAWFLLGKRHERLGGTWANPGGSLKPHESSYVGAVREFEEEVGIEFARLDGATLSHSIDCGDERVPYTLFVVDVPVWFNDVRPSWEHTALVWWHADEVGGLSLHPGFRRAWDALRVEQSISGAVASPRSPTTRQRSAVLNPARPMRFEAELLLAAGNAQGVPLELANGNLVSAGSARRVGPEALRVAEASVNRVLPLAATLLAEAGAPFLFAWANHTEGSSDGMEAVGPPVEGFLLGYLPSPHAMLLTRDGRLFQAHPLHMPDWCIHGAQTSPRLLPSAAKRVDASGRLLIRLEPRQRGQAVLIDLIRWLAETIAREVGDL